MITSQAGAATHAGWGPLQVEAAEREVAAARESEASAAAEARTAREEVAETAAQLRALAAELEELRARAAAAPAAIAAREPAADPPIGSAGGVESLEDADAEPPARLLPVSTAEVLARIGAAGEGGLTAWALLRDLLAARGVQGEEEGCARAAAARAALGGELRGVLQGLVEEVEVWRRGPGAASSCVDEGCADTIYLLV
jgi:hypothetical protein